MKKKEPQAGKDRGKVDAILKTLDGSEHHIRLSEASLPIECFRCGICCTVYQPLLSNEEIKTIARQLGLPAGTFLARYAQPTVIGYLLRQTKKGCVFLRWDSQARASCHIYPFRPAVCRNWAASLSRRECLEGLARLKTEGEILLAKELYSSPEAIERLCSILTDE
jgi:Fe-S-cluster containining protein